MMAGYPRTEKSFCDECGEWRIVRKVRVDFDCSHSEQSDSSFSEKTNELGAVSNVKRYLCEDCR